MNKLIKRYKDAAKTHEKLMKMENNIREQKFHEKLYNWYLHMVEKEGDKN